MKGKLSLQALPAFLIGFSQLVGEIGGDMVYEEKGEALVPLTNIGGMYCIDR